MALFIVRRIAALLIICGQWGIICGVTDWGLYAAPIGGAAGGVLAILLVPAPERSE